jgi:hypothetical protein
LAGAPADLGGVGLEVFRHRGQSAAQLDDVAIALFPIVEDRKIVDDLFDAHAPGRFTNLMQEIAAGSGKDKRAETGG